VLKKKPVHVTCVRKEYIISLAIGYKIISTSLIGYHA